MSEAGENVWIHWLEAGGWNYRQEDRSFYETLTDQGEIIWFQMNEGDLIELVQRSIAYRRYKEALRRKLGIWGDGDELAET
jgi:hypothetical protein